MGYITFAAILLFIYKCNDMSHPIREEQPPRPPVGKPCLGFTATDFEDVPNCGGVAKTKVP